MPSHLALFVCAAVALVPPCAAVGSASFIRASNTVGDTSFYDEVGRVRIFHGGNRVEKRAPWYFDDMLSSDAEFALMKKMGVNVIRLGYMWSGVNPTNSSYFNATYVDTIKKASFSFSLSLLLLSVCPVVSTNTDATN
jgi:endoglycosylceramidase